MYYHSNNTDSWIQRVKCYGCDSIEKFWEKFPMPIPQKTLQSVLLGVDRGKWEGGSWGFEGCVCLVGWWYLLYACYALDTNIRFLRDFMLLPNTVPK